MAKRTVRQLSVYMRKHIVAIVLVFGFTVTIGAGVAFAATVTQSPLDPSYTRVGHAVDKPFVVRLGSSVASIGAILLRYAAMIHTYPCILYRRCDSPP